MTDPDTRDWVGPVLERGPLAEVVIECLVEANPEARVVDRGAYWRVLVPERCVLARRAVEQRTGKAFRLPSDLERLMPSFKGKLAISDEDVRWTSVEADKR